MKANITVLKGFLLNPFISESRQRHFVGEAVNSSEMQQTKPIEKVHIQKPIAPVYKESRLRSILKGLTWRIVATTTIILIAYFTIGDISIAFQIGFVEFFIKLMLYYLHERAWQMVPRGGIRQIFKKK